MAKSLIGKITLISTVIQAVVITVLESLVVYYHLTFVSHYTLDNVGQGISESDVIYHLIFLISLIFQILLCVDALANRNSIQLIALVIFNLLTLSYAGVQLYQHRILEDQGTENSPYIPSTDFPTSDSAKNYFESKMRPLEYVIIGIVSFFSIYLSALVYKLYIEFGWENYLAYSADIKVRDALISLSILQTLIKMDMFAVGSYAIQLIPSQKMGYSKSIYETVLIFFIGTILMLMAWFSVTREMKYLLLSVINISCLSLIYLVYRLIKVNVSYSNNAWDPYRFTRRFLTFFLATTLVLMIATIFYGIICFRNMVKGIYVLTVYGAKTVTSDGGRRATLILQNQSRPEKEEID
ncbi:16532_t:CDS:2 [Acaulospora morrowiae]|uniref:16532_t:CDS:1 n=1 Tax=Acaulospora morrowiae TaxID=94023 RepID=A0A9N9DZA5_9GLOM|nr:16532_t:CDS:2 [Acaulospora morrowiae]